MPYIDRPGGRIYWESRGEGEPVLFIMGMAFSLDMWFRVSSHAAQSYRCILFDNRGAGRSDAPKGLFTIAGMADDAAAVLEAAGAESAHVLGASMGGMIAQELALRRPEMVRSLTLGCTHCGWLWSKLPRWRVFRAVWRTRRAAPERALEVLDGHLYHPRTAAAVIEEDRVLRLRHLPSARGYRNQILAVMLWPGSRWRLSRLRIPTIVIHGADDPLIPAENGRALAKLIPGAKLEVVHACSHVMPADQPERTVAIVLEFLAAQRKR